MITRNRRSGSDVTILSFPFLQQRNVKGQYMRRPNV